MNQESRITVNGTVRAQLPSGLYDVEIDGPLDAARNRPRRITAHAGSGQEKNFVRVLVGDRVIVELTPRDLTRGRIVKKA